MTVNLPRPLLFGGATLAGSFLILDVMSHTFGEWSLYALMAGAIGAVSWWWQRRSNPQAVALPAAQFVNPEVVHRVVAETERVLLQIQEEALEPDGTSIADVQPRVSRLQTHLSEIAAEMQREALRLAVFGVKGSGKTSLIQQLQAVWSELTTRSVTVWEITEFTGAVDEPTLEKSIRRATAADLVLFMITGDLTNSELQTLKQIASRKPTLLLLNKQDIYLPIEQQTLLSRIRSSVQGVLDPNNVVTIAAAPVPIKVRQHQSDGSLKEWMEERPPELANLTQRLSELLNQESQKLVLTTSLDTAVTLKTQAKQTLNELRRVRAMPKVEQYQWASAATAFASPIPTLDVLATAAISTQMILDVGGLYRQQFSLQQAQKMAATLGSLMLKQGLVELATQAIATLFKTNALTYVAGGCIQGISAAYLTRMAGLSLIEYFETQDPNLTLQEANPVAIERLSQILQSVFQKNQGALQVFAKQAIERLVPAPQQTTATLAPSPQLNASPLEPLHIPMAEARMPEPIESTVPLTVANLESTTVPSA